MAKREEEEFVVTDRRKFRLDGEEIVPTEFAREDRTTEADEVQPKEPPATEAAAGQAAGETVSPPEGQATEELLPEHVEAGPSAEDIDASNRAYQATTERMDDLMRANNPGAPQEGPVTFERVIQSLYVTAIVQLGLNTQAGQQMRVDLMGAKHTIDMLGVLGEKTKGNTTPQEDKLLQSALFELRMSFLEITQMLAQNAQSAARGGSPAAPGKVVL